MLRKKRSILPRPLPIPQLTRPTTTGEAATLPALAVDAVADVGSLWCVDHSNDLQLNARGQHLEEPTATPEEHRDQVDLCDWTISLSSPVTHMLSTVRLSSLLGIPHQIRPVLVLTHIWGLPQTR
jgi:hypothetical protein